MSDQHQIVFLDIEGTGLDVATAGIVEFGAVRAVFQDGKFIRVDGRLHCIINPRVEMSDEVVAIHGITNEMAKECEPFSMWFPQIRDLVVGSDLGGYNLLNYDVPLLWEEFARCGYKWDLNGVRIVDVGNIFKKREQRTLSSAARFYCDTAHEGAHSAVKDAEMTAHVLEGQFAKYGDLPLDLGELAAFSRMDDRVDLAGKIVRNAQGVPCFGFGKSKGVPVLEDIGFARWMLDRDFSVNTKETLRLILTGKLT